jgi:hypothetical protein
MGINKGPWETVRERGIDVAVEVLSRGTGAVLRRRDLDERQTSGPGSNFDDRFNQAQNNYNTAARTISIGAIVGIAIAGLVFIIFAIGMCCLISRLLGRRRRDRTAAPASNYSYDYGRGGHNGVNNAEAGYGGYYRKEGPYDGPGHGHRDDLSGAAPTHPPPSYSR